VFPVPYLIFFAAIFFFGFFPGAHGAAGQEPLADRVETVALSDIAAHDGRLWVDVKDYPVEEFFVSVGEAAGFEARIDRGYAERTITVRFNAVPLDRAISRLVRLLDTKNYRLSYDDDGRVARLEVFKPELSGGGAAVDPGRNLRAGRTAGRGARAARAVPERTRENRRRRQVRRTVAAPAAFDEELDEEWLDDSDEYPEQEWLDDEPFADDPEEDVPYLEPVTEEQAF